MTEYNIRQEEGEDRLTIYFDCPHCGQTGSYSYEENVDSDHFHTCGDCRRRYPIFPVGTPYDTPLEDMSPVEKVELQLKSVDIIEDIAHNNYGKTITVSASPHVAALAFVAITMGSIVTISASVILQGLLNTNILFAVGFSLWGIGLVFGIIASIYGPIGSIYTGYTLYSKYNPDCSFTEFVYFTANYHKNEVL